MTQEEIEDLIIEKLNEILPKKRCKGIGIVIGTF